MKNFRLTHPVFDHLPLSLMEGKKVKRNIKAFTLVELIIVITILAILATIAFVSFKGFMSDARDSNRLADLANVTKGLELYVTKSSIYPNPEYQSGTGTINGQILTYVGEFAENNSKIINFNKAIKDPLTKTNYAYGINSTQSEYQIASIMESGLSLTHPSYGHLPLSLREGIVPTTYANTPTQAKVEGNYKGYIKFNSGSDLYIANIPSLIFSNTGTTTELLSTGTYYIVNKKQNLPYDDKGVKTNLGVIQKITADILIKDITKSTTSTLTGVKITNLTKDNFDTYFTGDTLKSFNVAGIDINNTDNIKLTLKTGILGGGSISIPKTYASCSLSGETINHNQTITAFSENNIDKFAGYDCLARSQSRTCNDGVLSGSGTYQYTGCVKGVINNCSASGSYLYNTHTYSIPALNHGSGTTNILSSNVSENNGTFKYTLSSISCNDGNLINPTESLTPTIQSCNPGFGINGNSCSPSQNGSCNNTQAFSCITGDPIEDNGQTTCGQTITWKCSGLYGGTTSSQCSFNNGACNYFTGNGNSITPWIKSDGIALKSCQEYNLNATTKNDGVSRGSGTCGNGTQGCLSNGVYYIAPDSNQSNKFAVYCDMTTDGGGWTIIVNNNNSDLEPSGCIPRIANNSILVCGDIGSYNNDYTILTTSLQFKQLLWASYTGNYNITSYQYFKWNNNISIPGTQNFTIIADSYNQILPDKYLLEKIYCSINGTHSLKSFGNYLENDYNYSGYVITVFSEDTSISNTSPVGKMSITAESNNGDSSSYGLDDYQDGYGCGDSWNPKTQRGYSSYIAVK